MRNYFRATIAITALLALSASAFAAPSKLLITNSFGEESINVVRGSSMPIVQGASNIVSFAGATAPVDATTGDNFAAKGSLYFAIDSGVFYQNTGTITDPVWAAVAGGAAGGSYSEASPALTFDHSVGAKTVKVRKIGNVVSLTIPAAAIANGSGTACASTALASTYRPSQAITFSALVIDNGTTRKAGQVVLGTDGILTFSVLGTGFTNAQAAGWDAVSFSYSL